MEIRICQLTRKRCDDEDECGKLHDSLFCKINEDRLIKQILERESKEDAPPTNNF